MADETKKSNIDLGPSSDYLIRGSDYLAKHPEFKLVGRDQEMKEISNVLMRKDANNLILTGMPGVGVSALVMGLQASKEDPSTPFDIVGKRFYWLDTDALFALGDSTKISEAFQKTLATLKRDPDTVLVVQDARGFIDGTRNNGNTNIINSLMRELRSPDLQAIFETRDSDLAEVLKAHADFRDEFTMKEIKEPERAVLMDIVKSGAESLQKYHGVSIADEALKSAIDLTNKYVIRELEAGQPKRTFMLLEGALTALRHKAHSSPMELDALNVHLAAVDAALAGKPAPELAGKSADELNTLKHEAVSEIADIEASWEARQSKLRKLYKDQRKGEEEIRAIDRKIEEERLKQIEAGKQLESNEKTGVDSQGETATRGLQFKLTKSGFKGTAENELNEQRAAWVRLVEDNKKQFKALSDEINATIELKPEHVLAEFSRLSGVPVARLGQDETTKLLNLEATLGKRVFGQKEPVKAVAEAVQRGRIGLKKSNKPIGSFLFLGPSGVGKTELAKALAEALFGDEGSLKTYNMSEYQEKHSVSTLIGAPPGYEGYADGGLLTNNMRRQPYVVNVFDEIEKGHKDVYDLFLQILDEGKLADRRGMVASFANSINIMTSNIGAEHFLDEKIDFDEAKKRALAVLWNPDKENGGSGYRPEFLNRFTGIFCFNRLGEPELIMIADKNLKEINGWLAEKGINVTMDAADMKEMVKNEYIPRGGARSVQKFIEGNITSGVTKEILQHPERTGTLHATYDPASRSATVTHDAEAAKVGVPPANENKQSIAAPAAAAFKKG
ncbi:MAG TPA: AAA family ATPase [Patescibacteria group bacterium]|nr:AAA family ATPase [Patescibacteria group bacterium]